MCVVCVGGHNVSKGVLRLMFDFLMFAASSSLACCHLAQCGSSTCAVQSRPNHRNLLHRLRDGGMTREIETGTETEIETEIEIGTRRRSVMTMNRLEREVRRRKTVRGARKARLTIESPGWFVSLSSFSFLFPTLGLADA